MNFNNSLVFVEEYLLFKFIVQYNNTELFQRLLQFPWYYVQYNSRGLKESV